MLGVLPPPPPSCPLWQLRYRRGYNNDNNNGVAGLAAAAGLQRAAGAFAPLHARRRGRPGDCHSQRRAASAAAARPGAGLEPAVAAQGGLRAAAAAPQMWRAPPAFASSRLRPRPGGQSPAQGEEPVSAGGGDTTGGMGDAFPPPAEGGLCFVHPSFSPPPIPSRDWGLLAVFSSP